MTVLAPSPSPGVPAKMKSPLKHHSLASLLQNKKANAVKKFPSSAFLLLEANRDGRD